ncbi:MAG TPA: hypothetical protein VGF28_17460 [Thermoanaerobaculia bacterium]|jgi:hypothetical protein
MNSTAATILIFGLAVAVLWITSAYFRARYRTYRDLDFVAVDQQLKLVIEDPAGARATLSKQVTIVAKKEGLKEFVHREWSADGTFSEFKVDGQPANIETDAGDIIIRKVFSTPMRRLDRVTTTVSAVVTNSFNSSHEWLTFTPTYPIKHLEVEITLPHTRRAKRTFASERQGSETSEARVQPELDDDGTRITWSIDNVTDLTRQYLIEWEWPKR